MIKMDFRTFGRSFLNAEQKNQKNESDKKSEASFYAAMKHFSLLTSLHGFKYLFENSGLLGRIFWTIVLVSVFFACFFHTVTLIQNYNEGKLILTQENAMFRIWDIPFPAVTVCSDNQINETEFELSKFVLNENDLKSVKDYSDILCLANLHGKNYTQQFLSKTALKYAFTKLAMVCEDIMIGISWMNKAQTNICKYFQPIVLPGGVCFSLNMIHHNQLYKSDFASVQKYFWPLQYFNKYTDKQNIWDPVNGFKNIDAHVPPWRVTGYGEFNPVKIGMELEIDNFKERCVWSGGYGVTILVHSPIDHPDFQTSTIFVQKNAYVNIALSPQLISIADSLKHWNPNNRGCYYPHEKFLRYFKIYTQNNCEIECRVNRTEKECGCVAYYHPRSKKTAVCGMADRSCITRAVTSNGSVFENKTSIYDNKTDTEKPSTDDNCQCLPSCTELTYKYEVTHFYRNFSAIRNINPTVFSDKHKSVGCITLFYRSRDVESWIRSPIIRLNELIANVGGVLSLCIGCSIVSIFEIIYFLSIKLWSSKCKKKEKKITPKYNDAVVSNFLF